MALTIRHRLMGLAAVGAAFAIVSGWVGRSALDRVKGSVELMGVASTALRSQVEADMMHDGLRGDVYFALLARDDAERSAARESITEHAQLFRRLVKQNQELDLPPDVHAEIEAIVPVLDRYIASAERMLALAGNDRERAMASLTEFEKAFSDLEAPMETLSDSIEKVSDGAHVAKDASIASATSALTLAGVVGTLLLGTIATLLGRSIANGLQRTKSALARMAAGDLTVTLAVASNDEMGEIASALNDAAHGVRATVTGIAHSASVLSTSAEELSDLTRRMGAAAETASTRAGAVSLATDGINDSIQTVASAVEEMHGVGSEIAKNTTEAARVAGEAVEIAGATTDTVAKLGASSREIEKVIKVITSIAEQTNLLALNATIEAARAGEAGKGFAVVANEVKELASETTRATEEISRMISTIQGDTGRAIEAIARISQIIHQISDFQTSIAGAVQQQSATTNQIAQTVSEAARGSAEIAGNVTGVATVVRDTSEHVRDGQKSAEQLAAMARELHDVVGRFQL